MTIRSAKIALLAGTVLLALAATGCDEKAAKLPAGGPPGWVEVPCVASTGAKGPCYAPPGQQWDTADGQRCTVTEVRLECTPTPEGSP